MVKNQDNGLFEIDIKPEGKTKGRGRWPDKQLSQKPENKPMDSPDSGMNDANIINNNESNIGVLCIYDIDINEISENQGKPGKDVPFDAKELKFLELYLVMKESKTNAMNLAGYENYSDQWKRHIGSKIIERYETWAGDARIVFRKAGVGEVRLARTVDKLLKSSNEKTLLGASELTAKVLRANQDPGETRQGIQIVINTSAAPTPGPGLPCPPDGSPPDGSPSVEVKVTASKPLKPLAISK